jgi:hypothetical protein
MVLQRSTGRGSDWCGDNGGVMETAVSVMVMAMAQARVLMALMRCIFL